MWPPQALSSVFSLCYSLSPWCHTPSHLPFLLSPHYTWYDFHSCTGHTLVYCSDLLCSLSRVLPGSTLSARSVSSTRGCWCWEGPRLLLTCLDPGHLESTLGCKGGHRRESKTPPAWLFTSTFCPPSWGHRWPWATAHALLNHNQPAKQSLARAVPKVGLEARGQPSEEALGESGNSRVTLFL